MSWGWLMVALGVGLGALDYFAFGSVLFGCLGLGAALLGAVYIYADYRITQLQLYLDDLTT